MFVFLKEIVKINIISSFKQIVTGTDLILAASSIASQV